MAGLYSDLDDFIEGGGRDEELPEENVENEGNIPEGEPDTPSPQNEGNIESADPEPSTPQKSGNIKSEDSQPESPQKNQNITPEENQPETPQKSGNIQSESSQPESPQRSQNINPEESQPESPQRSENIKSEDSQPESPNRSQNISPEENQPESPQKSGNIQPESSEESEPERNSIPISENAPEPPQRRGNIKPRGLQNEPDREGINPQEDNQPSNPQRTGNISSREENAPQNPNRVEIEPDEEATPSETQKGSREARSDSTPESPDRRIINLREEAQPQIPTRSGNIQAEENSPSEPSKRGNIKTDEEPPTTEPAEDTNIEVKTENQPPEDQQSGNIKVNDQPPSLTNKEGNIRLREEVSPTEPSKTGNIQSEESSPDEPQREENIEANEERRPGEISQKGNITPTENPSPGEPSRTGNISPEENARPGQVQRSGNIEAEESKPEPTEKKSNITVEDDQPEESQNEGNISPTEESEPSEPNRNENITPPEEPQPSSPDNDGSISPTEESEPQEPDQDGFISPTEESEPKEPQKEGNIDPSNQETTDGTGTEPLSEPQKEGNINPKNKENTDGVGGEKLSEPQREGNIDPEDEETTDGIAGKELNREQPLKFQSDKFSSQIDPENTDFVDVVSGSEDGVPEWQPPLRYQSKEFAEQIKQQETKFVDTVAGKEDDTPEWQPPLRHQTERFAGQIKQEGKFVEVIPGKGDGTPERLSPLRHQRKRFAGQIDPTSAKFTDEVAAEFVGSNDSAAEWEVPLRHLSKRYADQINPEHEGGLYLDPKFVAGSNEPGDNLRNMNYDIGGASAKLKHQTAVKFALNNNIIDPSFEGGKYSVPKFVAGSDEPGDNIRNMEYDKSGSNAELRHQVAVKSALNNGIIDPNFEGGFYYGDAGSLIVVGGNEPGDQILGFGSTGDPSEEASFNAESSHPSNTNGPVLEGVPPANKADPKQVQFIRKNIENSVLTGSGEDRKFPDDNDVKEALKDREFQVGKVLQGLKPTESSEGPVLIDPSFEGGRYTSENYVLGSNEPGDQILDFGSIGDPSEESPFNAESSHPSNTNGPVLEGVPPADQADPKQIQFIRKNIENSVIVGSGEDRKFPDDDDLKEALEEREFQTGKVLQGLKTTESSERGVLIDPNFEGGIRGDGDSVVGGNEPGDDIRNMRYDKSGSSSELKHQIAVKRALNNGIIDPNFEGGFYYGKAGERIVLGGNEPGDQIFRFGSANDSSVEAPFNAESIHPSNTNGPILENAAPVDKADPKQVQFIRKNIENSVLTGSGENRKFPDDNETREHNEPLEFQSENIIQALKNGTLIDPEFEGGVYYGKAGERIVLGGNEPGDQILRFGDPNDFSVEASFNAESNHPSNTNGPILEGVPPANKADPKQIQFIRKNIENSVIVGSGEDRKFPDDNDVKEALKDREFQTGKVLQGLKPTESSEGPVLIDPSDEGGRRVSENFVVGSNEPGDQILRFGDPNDSSVEASFNAESNHPTNGNGPILENVPPAEQADPKQVQFIRKNIENSVLTGSGENRKFPDDNETREHNEPLEFQKEEIRQKLKNGTLINPSDEGGRRVSENFVVGSNEPGDQILQFGSASDRSEESSFNAESSHPTNDNGPILKNVPPADQADPKQVQFIRKNIENSVIIGSGEDRKFPDDNDVKEALEDREFQVGKVLQGLKPTESSDREVLIDPSFEGGIRGDGNFILGTPENDSDFKNFGVPSDPESESPFNVESSHASNTRGPILPTSTGKPKPLETIFQNNQVSDLERGSEPGENLAEFPDAPFGSATKNDSQSVLLSGRNSGAPKEEEFESQNTRVRLSEFESLFEATGDAGFNPGLFAEPFIQRKPPAGGGNTVRANIKQADSRTAPIGARILATERITKFTATAKGIVYNAKQFFLQKQNPRKRTQIYNPSAPVETAAYGMLERPGQRVKRHLDEGGFGSAVTSALSVSLPSSARYEDEIEEERTSTPYGDITGSLAFQTPVAQEEPPEVRGSEAVTTFRTLEAGNIVKVKQLYSTSNLENLGIFSASQSAVQGFTGSGYLFTNTYDPGSGQSRTDNYHPGAPYLTNIDSANYRPLSNNASFVPADISTIPDSADTNSVLLRLNQASRGASRATFPYVNPTRTPSTDDVIDGDGNIRSAIQNDTDDEAYYENRTFTDKRIPVHRGAESKSYGLPNYSITDSEGKKQKRIDLINRLEPIIGESADPAQEEFGKGSYKDLIPFKFYDIENKGLIVFRAFLESISDNLSPEWSQVDYAGRPEKGHTYGGYSNTISFSFKVAPMSEEEFEAIWKKVNYLKGLTTPSSYSKPEGGTGSYMVPPFMRLTIGDMFNDVYGYMNSLTIGLEDGTDWEIGEEVGRLPKVLSIDVDWQVIEKRAPVALQKYYDAPFIDPVEEVVRESAGSEPEYTLQSSDSPVEAPDVDQGRAIEKANEEPPGPIDSPAEQASTLGPNELNLPELDDLLS